MSSSSQKALFATGVGAVVNFCLAGSKGAAGLTVGSTALIADCFNSLGDLFSDAVVYYTVTEARKVATPERPWGTGKFEPLGAFVLSGLLAATGVGIAYAALAAGLDMAQLLSAQAATSADPSVVESQQALYSTLGPAQATALGVAGASVMAKEALFRYTLSAGRAARSDAVVANAWQHRADVFVSAAVFAGLAGSYAGYPILDPAAGLLVSGVILKQAWSIGRQSLRDLGDAPAAKEETLALRNTCLLVPGIQSVVDLKARQSGPFLYVECTVGVRGELSASAAHRLGELVRVELMRRHRGRVANAVVDVDPLGSTGLGELALGHMRSPEQITVEVKRALLEPWRVDPQIREKNNLVLEKVHQTAIPSSGTSSSGGSLAEAPPPPPPSDAASGSSEEEPVFNEMQYITSVSEVIVYYKDGGAVALKVDVCMDPSLTIGRAHKIAVLARRHLMERIEGLCEVDVDLELEDEDETGTVEKIKTKTHSKVKDKKKEKISL